MPAKSKNAIIFEVRFQISLLAYVDYQTFICIISSLWNIPLLTEFVVCIVNYRPSFSALIFVLVIWDAGSKKLHKFFQSCLFQICLFVCLFVCLRTIFLSLMGWGDHWSVWECENDHRHQYRAQNFKKDLLLPIFGFVAQKSVISCCTIIPFHPDQVRPYGALIKTV